MKISVKKLNTLHDEWCHKCEGHLDSFYVFLRNKINDKKEKSTWIKWDAKTGDIDSLPPKNKKIEIKFKGSKLQGTVGYFDFKRDGSDIVAYRVL